MKKTLKVLGLHRCTCASEISVNVNFLVLPIDQDIC